MFYGIVRAVIQDLRFSVHHVGTTMSDAYKRVTSQPSQSNLGYCEPAPHIRLQPLKRTMSVYHLQDRLFILSLDATSLKNAAINLNNAADKMHKIDEERVARGEGRDPKRLISERTRYVYSSVRLGYGTHFL
jgi:hypothetical protein